MSVVVNEFEIVPSPPTRPQGDSTPTESSKPQDPWAAVLVAEGQRRLAERAERLEAT